MKVALMHLLMAIKEVMSLDGVFDDERNRCNDAMIRPACNRSLNHTSINAKSNTTLANIIEKDYSCTA
jgi:hypothetical protein